MKKLITTLLAASFLLIAIPACKKDPVAEKTQKERITGKWMFETVTGNDHYSGTDHPTYAVGGSSDYMDFRSDGMVLTSFSGNTDNVAYSFPSETVIIIDGDAFDIKTFTQNQFTMYRKQNYGGGDYDEVTVTLKR
jgi:hypothetical protein